MKYLYHLLATGMLCLLASQPNFAQTSLTTAVDFDVTDTDGYSHNLFDALNSGQYVLVNFFAHLSDQSQGVADDLGDLFVDFGCNQQDVYILCVDFSGNDSEVADFKSTYGGIGPYASGDDGGGFEAHELYGISSYPSIVLIAPDRSIIEQGIWPASYTILKSKLDTNGITEQACVISGLEETEFAEEIKYYPNPATDFLQIDLGDYSSPFYSGETIVTVVDQIGRVLAEFDFKQTSESLTIPVSNLKPGLYTIYLEMVELDKSAGSIYLSKPFLKVN